MVTDPFTLETAIAAGKTNTLKEWLISYLEGHGNNQKLADALKENNAIDYSGPIEMELSPMRRIAGSAKEGLKWVDADWENNIQKMVDAIKSGWNPPPLILTDYWDPKYHLTDGNHRCEALMRAGYEKYWTIVLKCSDHGVL
jgi:hypothetical protein